MIKGVRGLHGCPLTHLTAKAGFSQLRQHIFMITWNISLLFPSQSRRKPFRKFSMSSKLFEQHIYLKFSFSEGLIYLDYSEFPGLAWVANSFSLLILSLLYVITAFWCTLCLESLLCCYTEMKCSSLEDLDLLVPFEVGFFVVFFF